MTGVLVLYPMSFELPDLTVLSLSPVDDREMALLLKL